MAETLKQDDIIIKRVENGYLVVEDNYERKVRVFSDLLSLLKWLYAWYRPYGIRE
jgi:hypothetical protein